MIAVRIIGGLGNQMFQYAAARRLSVVHGTSLELDLTAFRTYHLHSGFRLNHFALPNDISFHRQDRLADLLSERAAARVRRGLSLIGLDRRRVIRETFFQFDSRILELGDGVYLDGYWQ